MLLMILRQLRPRQWSKNFFVLAPLFFSLKFLDIESCSEALCAVLAFSAIASGIYCLNDIADRHEDRAHPRKRIRPIASGALSVRQGYMIAAASVTVGCLALTPLPLLCAFIMALYSAVQLCYTLRFKHVAIYDVTLIASGFVLRVLMGAYAIDVPVSAWIIVTTFFLALFLGFGKRYHELGIKGYDTARRSLERYNPLLLQTLITMCCVATLLSYSLYTIETARALKSTALVYTIIFVMLGLCRYLQLLYVDESGGEPERILLSDVPFIINGVMWLVTTLALLAHAYGMI